MLVTPRPGTAPPCKAGCPPQMLPGILLWNRIASQDPSRKNVPSVTSKSWAGCVPSANSGYTDSDAENEYIDWSSVDAPGRTSMSLRHRYRQPEIMDQPDLDPE